MSTEDQNVNIPAAEEPPMSDAVLPPETPVTASQPDTNFGVPVELTPIIVPAPNAQPVLGGLPEVPEPDVVHVPMMEMSSATNVRQEFSEIKKGTLNLEGKLDRAIETIALPAGQFDLTQQNMNHPAAREENTELDITWGGIFAQGETTRVRRGTFSSTVERIGSDFRQYLETGNGKVGFASPRLGEREGQKLTGENALLRIRALMNIGGLVQVPLYHSGFHITLKTPKDSAFLELRERNEQARIQLGRNTFGMAFSNTSGFIVENVMSLIEDHIYITTLKDSTNLRKKISVLDLPILIWGLACCIWPNGFQFARSSVTEGGIANKQILTGLIDVSKLMWVDQNMFTDRQKAHMSNRQPEQVTQDMIDIYRGQFVSNTGSTMKLRDDAVTITMKVPSIEEYIVSTHKWVDSLVGIIDRTFTGDRTDLEGRNRSILNHANLSRMRQYSHWIGSVNVEGNSYSDGDTIDQMLEILSDHDDSKVIYFPAIDKFISDSTAAIIAIPEISGKETNLPRFPRLIPIDVLGVFFTLLMHRVSRILPTEE